MENSKLQKIVKKYSELNYNSDNYNVGGGMKKTGKKASNRHEDAKALENEVSLRDYNIFVK